MTNQIYIKINNSKNVLGNKMRNWKNLNVLLHMACKTIVYCTIGILHYNEQIDCI